MNLLDPCPDSRCTHDGDCAEAKLRRAHTCTVVPAPKMDAPKLVAAVCSCGQYQSSPGSESRVRAAHAHHAAAKLAAAAKSRCPTCKSDDPATKLMTGCGFVCDDPSRWHAAGRAVVQP